MLPKIEEELGGKVLFTHLSSTGKMKASGLLYFEYEILITLKLFGEFVGL